MKITIVSQRWSYEDYEAGESDHAADVYHENIPSLDGLVRLMQYYSQPSVYPVTEGCNFWVSDTEEVYDALGGCIEKSMHVTNPTPHNIKLWHKAYLLSRK